MTLLAPTHTVVVLRPHTITDEDPYDPGADSPEDTLASGVRATVWFPRLSPTDVADDDQVLRLRVLVDPIPGVVIQRGDILSATTGQRYRVESAEARVGVSGLEHTACEATQVRRPVAT